MSYNDFSSNPNNFGFAGSTTGADARQTDERWDKDPASGSTRDQQFAGAGTGTGIGAQGKTWDPTEGGDFTGNSQQSGLRDPYRGTGNTTDFNTPGTGGDFTGTHRDADQQFEARRPVSTNNWTSDTGATDGNRSFERPSESRGEQQQQSSGTGTGKPSIGDRLKGTMERTAGKVAGNQGMVERGEERKLGDNTGSQY